MQQKNTLVIANTQKRTKYLDEDARVVRFAIAKMLRQFRHYSPSQQTSFLLGVDYRKILEDFYVMDTKYKF